MNLDTIYGGGASVALLDALTIPGHPPAITGVTDGYPPKVHVSWQNGAHMTVRPLPGIVHFQELCSAVGREHPTGLYTVLCEQLPPVLRSLNVELMTCEPATDFAKDKLARRGEWEGVRTVDGHEYWVWWLGKPSFEALRVADDLVSAVIRERGA